MRVALATALTLVLAASARADVLVPADPAPPARPPAGVSAARDLIAFGRSGSGDVFASGRRVRFAGEAPQVAAAADGTAIVVTRYARSVLARVRRGGRFGKTVRVGGAARLVRLAAAPGGWTAVAWLDGLARRLSVAVVDPKGHVRRTVLERARDIPPPAIGIDGSGHTTVAWTRNGTVRFARGDAGKRWTQSRLTASAAPEAGLAVAPGGHWLLAWAARDRVRATLDGGPPQTLAPGRAPGTPAPAVNDDGTALVAYPDDFQVFAVDRVANGPWTLPHRISGDPQPRGGTGADSTVSSALAADGRAVVAWPAERTTAASGRAGGAWAAAQALSSPLRIADPPLAALDAAGVPFVLWVEITQSTLEGRVHGARLVPDVPLDTTPPKLTAKLPDRVDVARNGAFAFRVPVACDEACDVRVDVYNANGKGARYELRELSLPAGGSATVRLSPSPYDERTEVRLERPKRMQILVRAADRAGNVASASVTARVQRR